MGQEGAGERAGWCCVRGDRRTRAVYGDDARESPADEAHGVGECGARGHAATGESSGEVLRTIDSDQNIQEADRARILKTLQKCCTLLYVYPIGFFDDY